MVISAVPQVDPTAVRLRGFGPLGIFAIVVIVASQLLAPLSAVLVLIWAKRSRTPWHEIGVAIIYLGLEADVAHLVFR